MGVLRRVMGHLPIVTQTTFKDVIKEGSLSTRGDLKFYMVKTISDIFADVLATRKGDLIFPWIIKDASGKNIGFKYVFKVAGPPIFIKGENYPVKIPLENEGLEYETPLSEAEALDLWDLKLLWNVIGKKSLGRGRSLSHQTPMEDKRMLELLDKKNPKGPKKIKLGEFVSKGNLITINSSQDEWNSELKASLDSAEPSNKLSLIELDGVPWRKEKRFAVEKTLEAWLMENLDKPSCDNFRKMALLKNIDLEWFGNYLPFGVQGSNLDVVIVQSKENKKVITVVELKVGPLNAGQFRDAAKQVIDYSLFIKDAFNAFGIEIELNPIVVSGTPNRAIQVSEIKEQDLIPKWLTYSLNEKGEVKFKKVQFNKKLKN